MEMFETFCVSFHKSTLFTVGCAKPVEGTGTVPVSGGARLNGKTYKYQCAAGKVYNGDYGDLKITCTDGEWSNTNPPTCVGKT